MAIDPQVPEAPMQVSKSEIRSRSNVLVQLFRFAVINLKMIGIIRKGHN